MKMTKNMKIALVIAAIVVIVLLLYVGMGNNVAGQAELWPERIRY